MVCVVCVVFCSVYFLKSNKWPVVGPLILIHIFLSDLSGRDEATFGSEPCVPLFPSFLGRDEATRTPDPYVPNVVRYQLRYIPNAIQRGSLLAAAKVRSFFQTRESFKDFLRRKKKNRSFRGVKCNTDALFHLKDVFLPLLPGAFSLPLWAHKTLNGLSP